VADRARFRHPLGAQEMNVPAGAKIPLLVVGAGVETGTRIETHLPSLLRLARLENVAYGVRRAAGSAQIVLGEATFVLPLAGVIDIDAERLRLDKDIAKDRRRHRQDRPQAG
jgi:valyl-tRNA synthetase